MGSEKTAFFSGFLRGSKNTETFSQQNYTDLKSRHLPKEKAGKAGRFPCIKKMKMFGHKNFMEYTFQEHMYYSCSLLAERFISSLCQDQNHSYTDTLASVSCNDTNECSYEFMNLSFILLKSVNSVAYFLVKRLCNIQHSGISRKDFLWNF